jgi:hypothetical protein
MSTPNYYVAKRGSGGGRKLVALLKRTRHATTTLSVCGRDGEVCRAKRRYEHSAADFRRRYRKAELAGPCTCPGQRCDYLDDIDIGLLSPHSDCYSHHKVFVCFKCKKVIPWCHGADSDQGICPDCWGYEA